MTEQEAAERLCTLLNEIEAAGIPVSVGEHRIGYGSAWGLDVGNLFLAEPPCEDEPWEVREL